MNSAITVFNNSGICDLLTGENDDAIRNFRNSLALLKFEVNRAISRDEVLDRKADFPALSQSRKERNLLCLSLSLTHQALGDPIAPINDAIFQSEGCSFYLHPALAKLVSLEETGAFIYSRPLTIFGRLSLEDDHFLPIHSAVVIFNLALAHHQKSKVTGVRKLLEKAIALYDLCLELLHQDERQHLVVVFIESAVLNNTSQLHFEMGDYYGARKVMDQLSALLGAGYYDVLTRFDEEAVQGFLLNILLLKTCAVASAA
jgi:tetratricopeptide (TPR) repeat protein